MTTAEMALRLKRIARVIENNPQSANDLGNASDALWIIQQNLKAILAEGKAE